ncbi:hypothetical protein NDU88_006438 [Pleurodeles waltl]|uniref:Uncharacterized protein n=1 Tax=Pleurodeles waltl TaxID=8319 RepID=A0AAV7TXN0_PLEWA|nr:hypothetical protein NDU88_006438 [Pleurodeles waltl]
MLTGTRPVPGGAAEGPQAEKSPETRGEVAVHEESPVTKGFLTSLFYSLRSDIQELRRDLSQEVRELRGEVTSLGGRVAQMEDGEISHGEEVAGLQQEVVRLREQQDHLQITVEALENRLRRHNIQIRGVPAGAEKEDIGDFVVELFRSLLGLEETREITLDRVHRVGRAGGAGDRPPDILACVHSYGLKESILHRARNLPQVHFRGHTLQLFQDLSARTLHRRRELKPITEHLRAHDVTYSWGHPFHLAFGWEDQLRQVRTVSETNRILCL